MVTPTPESDILLIVLGLMSLAGIVSLVGAFFSLGRAASRKD